MTRIRSRDSLAFVTAALTFRGRTVLLTEALLDTGSASTLVSAALAEEIDLLPELGDAFRRIRGVGGSEAVFAKRVDAVTAGDLRVADFEVEVGAMEYGIRIDAILGLDFLTATGAVVDLGRMELRSTSRRKRVSRKNDGTSKTDDSD